MIEREEKCKRFVPRTSLLLWRMYQEGKVNF